MELNLSPKYLIQLAKDIENAIWKVYPTYKDVRFYIFRWHKYDERNDWENFRVIFKEDQKIDLLSTLNNIDSELLIKMAIDLGVPTPDFIPCVPIFENLLKNEYRNSYEAFTKARREVYENPDLAIGLANSTLEGIIKDILKDDRISIDLKGSETLYKLSQELLKQLQLSSNTTMPTEIKTIGSSILNMAQNIEKIRSDKTRLHGNSSEDFIIDESIYATFIINSVTTIGLFLENYYKSIYSKLNNMEEDFPF
jgi:hypothetical protein